MHQIYAQYLQTAFEQCREQLEKIVQRGTTLIGGVTHPILQNAAARPVLLTH